MSAINKIAIVILNWNGKKLFSEYLPSVTENSKGDNIEIIIADNGSTDDSVSFLNNSFPEVRIIGWKKNLGFAGGYNKVLAEIKADLFVILNSDIKVTPGWLDSIPDLFNQNRNLAAIQPKILSKNEPEKFEYAGAAGGFIDKFGYPFCRGRLLNSIEEDNGQYDNMSSVFWASGACMFVRAEYFREAGGFDPDFWAHMEEIDLCWRFKNMGYQVIYEPKSVVYHLGGGTLSYQNPLKIHLNFRNNLWMLFKNLPDRQFKRIFILRMILDGIAAFKFLAGFYLMGFWAVTRAHFEFYKNLPVLIKKRKATQRLVIKKDHAEIYGKSIMWKFFIQKIRKFSQLGFNPSEYL